MPVTAGYLLRMRRMFLSPEQAFLLEEATDFESSPLWSFSNSIFVELNLGNHEEPHFQVKLKADTGFNTKRDETLPESEDCLVDQIKSSETELKGKFPRGFQSFY